MQLPNTLIRDKRLGFTLVEVLIAVAILFFLGVMGTIVGLDSYQKYLFRSDLDTAAALLSKARSSAVHSIGEEGVQKSHGVHFAEDGFVLFRTEIGQSYNDPARDDTFDLFVEKSKVTNVSGADEVVFNPPSGESFDSTVTISNGSQDFVITINKEGGLDW